MKLENEIRLIIRNIVYWGSKARMQPKRNLNNLLKDGLPLNCGGSAGPICYALHQGEDQQMGSGHNDNSGRGESLLRSVLPCCKTTIIAIVQLSSNGNGSIILIWTSAVTTQQVLTKGALEN